MVAEPAPFRRAGVRRVAWSSGGGSRLVRGPGAVACDGKTQPADPRFGWASHDLGQLRTGGNP